MDKNEITIKNYMSVPVTMTVEEYIKNTCSGSDYDRGAIETAQAAADNTAEVLGRLVELLQVKGLLTRAEVVKLGRGY